MVALRIGNAVADGKFRKSVRPLRNFGKGVACFAGGGCTFGNVADGLKESATTKSVRSIEGALGGRVIMC